MKNPHAKIFILDTVDPETAAMLQAYYSRSQTSIAVRAQELGIDLSPEYKPSKIKDALRQYYIGYGHGSIGKQGVTYVFFENVSMLFAKALQQHPLYAGQETSTRYIDFTKQPRWAPECIRDPATEVYERCINFISNSKPVLEQHLKTIYPLEVKTPAEQNTYDRAISARAFDILRGFLPTGSLTNVSWTTSLQNARDHLRMMCRHPLEEVSSTARQALRQLHVRYPDAFKAEDYAETNEVVEFYLEVEVEDLQNTQSLHTTHFNAMVDDVVDYGNNGLSLRNAQNQRWIPHQYSIEGQLTALLNIDFGSFRDLQRHQRGITTMPIVSWMHACAQHPWNFHPWYLEQLPEDLRSEAEDLLMYISEIYNAPELNSINEVHAQYMLPMGTVVSTLIKYSLIQAKYVIELRTKQTVHPTLRKIMQHLGETILAECPWMDLDINHSPDGLCIARGNETIFLKTPDGTEEILN